MEVWLRLDHGDGRSSGLAVHNWGLPTKGTAELPEENSRADKSSARGNFSYAHA